MTEEEAAARSLAVALLDASRIYEGFVIPRSEGFLRRKPFPPQAAVAVVDSAWR
jgi:hypothetical protein